MIWQDVVLSTGQLVFVIALLPAVIGEEKPPFWTCIITGLTILIFAFTFTTLGLLWSAFTSAMAGVIWLLLAWQSWKLRRGRR